MGILPIELVKQLLIELEFFTPNAVFQSRQVVLDDQPITIETRVAFDAKFDGLFPAFISCRQSAGGKTLDRRVALSQKVANDFEHVEERGLSTTVAAQNELDGLRFELAIRETLIIVYINSLNHS